MKYSIDAINKASKLIDERRANAISLFEKNKGIAYEEIPELREIDSALSMSGLKISKEVISNKSNIKDAIERIKNENEVLIKNKKALLVKHGFTEDFLSIPYYCKKCSDTGYVDAMPCECLKTILEKNAREEAEKNKNNERCTFENFNLNYYPDDINGVPCKKIMQQTFDNCKEYAQNFSTSSPNIFIFGGTGIGKTHISISISNEVAKKGYDVIYMSAPDLFSSLEKERFGQDKPIQNMQSVTQCDLLIIDDLGSEFTTSFTVSALYNIINTRILSNLPTIITANLLPSELSQKYSERIASRLLGCYEHLRFIGNDIRILKKKNS